MFTESHRDLVDAAFAHFRDNEMSYKIGQHGQQENKDSIDHIENMKESNSNGDTTSRHSIDFTITTSNLENFCTNDDDINDRIISLNTKQIYIFDYVHKWARDYVKNQSCKVSKQVKPIRLFITGGAGIDNSHLMKTIYFSVTKTLI